MITATVPDSSEAAEYYFTYIKQVPAGDIGDVLAAQAVETVEALSAISEEDSLRRYTQEKWSIREVVAHINDTERLIFRGYLPICHPKGLAGWMWNQGVSYSQFKHFAPQLARALRRKREDAHDFGQPVDALAASAHGASANA